MECPHILRPLGLDLLDEAFSVIVPASRKCFFLQQVSGKSQVEARFDDFMEVFNRERQHEALDMKCPAAVYQPSARPYRGLPDIDFPFRDKIVVTNCARICLGNKKINFSKVFAGQAVGIKEVHDDIWPVSCMDYDLGYFDPSLRARQVALKMRNTDYSQMAGTQRSFRP